MRYGSGDNAMLADYTVGLQHIISSMTIIMTNVRAESEQDAIETAKQHCATPHHWKSFKVWEQ